MKGHGRSEIRMIPIDSIEVVNSRQRDSRVFGEVVDNIRAVGLKKPIKVTPRQADDGSERYLLVCGEGRINAYKKLGETVIPALVVDVSDEDASIMSLAENIARRWPRPLERLAGIRRLYEQGYTSRIIAEKTGLSRDHVQGIMQLFHHGEERLLIAVEMGRIPLSAALMIAGAGDDAGIESALQDAYESGKLRGRPLLEARRVIERRKCMGRADRRGVPAKGPGVTSSSLVRAYENEVERQKAMIRKADFTQQRLIFVIGALRQLLAEENFVNLLRAEEMATLPKYLADRVWPTGSAL